jgi:glycosyltransferase involved in cell wall biosynthesis
VSRILLVGKGPPDRGGISAYLQAMLESALAERHELSLLNLTREETPRTGRLTRANVSRTLSDSLALWRAAHPTDVVHIHSALAPGVTMARAGSFALVARMRGAKVLVHAHSGKVEPWLVSLPRRVAARLLLAPAQRVAAVSEGSRSALARALGAGRVSLIENGVDPDAFPAADPVHDPPQILSAGVLSPRKGLIDLVEASQILTHRGLRHELVFAGGRADEGPEAEAAVRQAAGGAVRFLGPIPHIEMPSVYASADVFCLPSWWEAMPLSVLEAMAAGLPVVATATGDVSRAVDDGITGRLVPPRRPDLLAAALADLLDDPETRRQMGRAGRRRVKERFDFRHSADALDGLYQRLCGKNRPGRPEL